MFDEHHELPQAPLLETSSTLWSDPKLSTSKFVPREKSTEIVQRYFDTYGPTNIHYLLIAIAIWAAISDAIEIVAGKWFINE